MGFLTIYFAVLSLAIKSDITNAICPRGTIALYDVRLNTFWGRDLFPKHFPQWRPPASWSHTLGWSHASSFVAYHEGEVASAAFSQFAESADDAGFQSASQGSNGTFDFFFIPPISTGVGEGQVRVMADWKHPMLSLITKLVPSPDWFVGIDSFDLCPDGSWIGETAVELHPMDAGIDQGLTFTSPSWPMKPPAPIKPISAHDPAHPAGSFYYPDIDELPTIAIISMKKLLQYQLDLEFDAADARFKKKNDVFRYRVEKKNETATAIEDIGSRSTHRRTSNHLKKKNRSKNSKKLKKKNDLKSSLNYNEVHEKPRVYGGDAMSVIDHILKDYQRKHRKKMRKMRREEKMKSKKMKKIRPPRDCEVTKWSIWSSCSKSCGIGERARNREIVKHSKRGGKPCPALKETTWCGSAGACPRNYFQWH